MKSKEYLEKQSKEQLIIFLHNEEYENERLRQKLLLLTGCQAFGDMDGMDGACVACNKDHRCLADRCYLFSEAYIRWWKKEQREKEKENNKVNVDLSF